MTRELPDKLLFQSDAQFVAFCQYEAERREHRERTGNGRPIGARLSMSCPVRMVKVIFDPERFTTPIDEGDAERGHEFESRFRAIVLDGIEHTYQPTVDWGIGVSAWDFHVPSWDTPIAELKTTIGGRYLHADWRITTERRMVAAGLQPGAVVDVFGVHPGNLDLFGPFPVELSEHARDHHAATLDSVATAIAELDQVEEPTRDARWDNVDWWADIGLECSCGWCEPIPEWDANPAMERMIARYHLHLSAFQEACEDARHVLGLKVKSREWLDGKLHRELIDAAEAHARAKGSEGRVKIQCWAADYDLVRNVRGVWQVKARKTAPVEAEAVA